MAPPSAVLSRGTIHDSMGQQIVKLIYLSMDEILGHADLKKKPVISSIFMWNYL